MMCGLLLSELSESFMELLSLGLQHINVLSLCRSHDLAVIPVSLCTSSKFLMLRSKKIQHVLQKHLYSACVDRLTILLLPLIREWLLFAHTDWTMVSLVPRHLAECLCLLMQNAL
jgi:hypothetical protein